MIPYDSDIDIGMLHRDHNRALSGKEHLPDRYDLVEICRFWPYQKLFPFLNHWKRKTFLRLVDKKTGWFIDIFEYRETANGYKLMPWVFYHEHFDTYDHGLYRNCFPKDLIFPLRSGEYEQKYFPIPKKSKEVLEILYGKDFMTPDHIWDEENKQWRMREV